MFTTADIATVTGGDVYGADNTKIGSVGQIYLDNDTDQPEWVTVKTGLFGTKESFVPLANASVQGNDIHVPYSKDKVKDAPRIDSDGAITPADEDELYQFYGVNERSADTSGRRFAGDDHVDTAGLSAAGDDAGADRAGAADSVDAGDRAGAADTAGPDAGGQAHHAGHDTSGPNTDSAMTRSEEQLHIGTQTEQTGRARLRKYVVTEEHTRQVPVSHEEVTIEREPITDANINSATDGPQIGEEEHEVILHAERPVVEKEVTPVERIRLGTETVTEDATVTETVRKEQVELDDNSGDHGPR